MKSRPGYSGDLGKIQGICLATSNDGSIFNHHDADNDGFRDVVLMQSKQYPVSQNYIGYSTPFAFVDNSGVFHLFYDVVTDSDTEDWRQVAIAHATSSDGIAFSEIEHNIITIGSSEWLKREVRAPCVIEDGTSLKMWFAGHSDINSTGIGYAVYKNSSPKRGIKQFEVPLYLQYNASNDHTTSAHGRPPSRSPAELFRR